MEKICAYCQKSFIVKRIDVLYCSRTCRQMAYMNRKIEGLTNQALLEASKKVTRVEPNEATIDTSPELVTSSTTDEDLLDQTIDTSFQTSEVSRPTIGDHYEQVESELIKTIYDQIESREIVSTLNSCIHRQKDFPSLWVSIRVRCLLECLLMFTDMKNIKVSSLMEVCNAFILVAKSEYYKKLPGTYPYTDEIYRLKEKLKKLCYKVQQVENIKFYLSKEDKIELIILRYELSRCIPKMKFSQLDFKE